MFLKAYISNISRGSFHDGSGVRTVVYFKGCSLRCAWCHNPETFSEKPDIIFLKDKCICCGECIKLCPENHKPTETFAEFIRTSCTRCGKCAEVCPSKALSVCGEQMSVSEVFEEILKDKHYYLKSGGGVTFSGGECLLQPEFLQELLKKCKEENIHTAIESAFFVPYENVKKVLPYLDFIYADLKIPDSEKHKTYTGKGNELIIENIKNVSNEFSDIVIRIPLIPNVNDSVSDMRKFAGIINTFGDGIKGVELLKYNYLAESKYEALGKKYTEFAGETQSEDYLSKLSKALLNELNKNIKVFFT